MKRFGFILFTLSLLLVFSLFSCGSSSVRLNKDNSYFSHFEIDGGKVYLQCVLYLENDSEEEKSVRINAFFEDEVNGGLIYNGMLDGYTAGMKRSVFTLQSGINIVEVIFVGDHAGAVTKQNRSLPDIQIQEVN